MRGSSGIGSNAPQRPFMCEQAINPKVRPKVYHICGGAINLGAHFIVSGRRFPPCV